MSLTKKQREFLKTRISELLSREPWLTNYTISVRFACSREYVGEVRRSLGLFSPRSEELTKNDFDNSLVPILLPKRRKKPHYINFGEEK